MIKHDQEGLIITGPSVHAKMCVHVCVSVCESVKCQIISPVSSVVVCPNQGHSRKPQSSYLGNHTKHSFSFLGSFFKCTTSITLSVSALKSEDVR